MWPHSDQRSTNRLDPGREQLNVEAQIIWAFDQWHAEFAF